MMGVIACIVAFLFMYNLTMFAWKTQDNIDKKVKEKEIRQGFEKITEAFENTVEQPDGRIVTVRKVVHYQSVANH